MKHLLGHFLFLSLVLAKSAAPISKEELDKQLSDLQPWFFIPEDFEYTTQAYTWNGQKLVESNLWDKFGMNGRQKRYSKKLQMTRHESRKISKYPNGTISK